MARGSTETRQEVRSAKRKAWPEKGKKEDSQRQAQRESQQTQVEGLTRD